MQGHIVVDFFFAELSISKYWLQVKFTKSKSCCLRLVNIYIFFKNFLAHDWKVKGEWKLPDMTPYRMLLNFSVWQKKKKVDLIWLIVVKAIFSNIMATSFSSGTSRSSRREPPTIGKQLVNFITCESSAPFFIIYKAGLEPTPYWW